MGHEVLILRAARVWKGTRRAGMSATLAGMTRPLALCCLLLCLLAAPAWAWGPLGHRLVARLAEPQLTPAASAEVRRLLATEQVHSLADVANWADDLRKRDPVLGRRSAKWHYVNLDGDDCRFIAARDCPGGDCVVEALRGQAAILADDHYGSANADTDFHRALIENSGNSYLIDAYRLVSGKVSAMPPGDVSVHSDGLPGRTAKSWKPSAADTMRTERIAVGAMRR